MIRSLNMVQKGTLRRALLASALLALAATLGAGAAQAGQSVDPAWTLLPPAAPEAAAPLVLADRMERGGEEIDDGSASVSAQEAPKAKDAGQYSGPLGGLGIKCEDQKDLEALALGTYGNVVKALTGAPAVVNCPERPEGGGAPAEGSSPTKEEPRGR